MTKEAINEEEEKWEEDGNNNDSAMDITVDNQYKFKKKKK